MEVNEYLDIFIDESKEIIQSLNEHLLELEKEATNLEIINEIIRSAHTLKGMSATMGYQDLADLTHIMENVLDSVRNQEMDLDSDTIDVIFNAVDALEAMIIDIANGGEGKQDVSQLVKQLSAIESGEQPVSDQKAEPAHERTMNIKEQLDQFELALIQQSLESGFE